MIIKHSELMNDFISFWFDSRVDDQHQYRTFLDYMSKTWRTVDLINNEVTILEGKLDKTIALEDEAGEIERIRFEIQNQLSV